MDDATPSQTVTRGDRFPQSQTHSNGAGELFLGMRELHVPVAGTETIDPTVTGTR